MGREISENSAEFADMIYQLKELTGKYGAACILIHHSNKNPEALGVGRIRGNTSIAGAVWGTWIIDRIPVPDPNNPKRLIIDPSDPKRTLSIIPRDTQGQNLKIELNPDNLSFSPSDEEDEAQEERKTQKQQILELLAKYAPKGLTGREILETLDLPRSAYNTLSRMVEQRLITERQSSGDHRVMVYCLSTPPLPPHSYKVMTNLAESTVVKPKTNSHQIVINSEKNSHHLNDEKSADDELIPEPASNSAISHQKDCAQGGGGDAEETQTQTQLTSDIASIGKAQDKTVNPAAPIKREPTYVTDDGTKVFESAGLQSPVSATAPWKAGDKFRYTGTRSAEMTKKYAGRILTVKSYSPARGGRIEAEETKDGFSAWVIERVADETDF
jgi:Fe2+ or Zn2+ uptake regulation protein